MSSEAYDGRAAQRQLGRYEGALARYFLEQEQELVLSGVQIKDSYVLDLGCGVGRLSRALVDRGARAVLACDLSPAMVKTASASNADARVNYVVCDGQWLPLPDESVDVVFALGTLEAVSDISPFAREMRRVLRPHGVFIFTVWNRDRWYRLHCFDGRRSGSMDHDATELRQVLEANAFSDVRARTTFFLPRQLFWGCYRVARLLLADGIFVWLCNAAARFLRGFQCTMNRGWVLVISSKAAVR